MKISKNTYRRIDLSLINKTENIRQDMGDIAELADSIKNLGQLEAIGVVEREDGRFDMLYGFRRLAAFQFLVDAGQDYNQIEAKIITGDPLIIQMAENEARKNLTAAEYENGVAKMMNAGMSQSEIAKCLGKQIQNISDTLKAWQARQGFAKQGLDTAGMSTAALSALRNTPESEAPEIIKAVKEKGGTVKAVKEVKEAKKKKDNPEMFIAHEPEVIEEKQEPVDVKKAIDQLPTGVGKQPIIDAIENQKADLKAEYSTTIEQESEKINQAIKSTFIPVILESPFKDFCMENGEFRPAGINVQYAKACCIDCIRNGESPYASHLQFPQFLDENEERETGLAAGQAWYAHAAYMVVYDDYGITPGMQAGIDYFKSIKPDAKIEMRKLYKEGNK